MLVLVEPEMLEGGLVADRQLLHYGTPNEALKAAKRLCFNPVLSLPGTQCLDQDGTVRAMMKVFNNPDLSLEDVTDLYESVWKLVFTRARLAAEVVAACADPDPRTAFAALACTKILLGSTETSGAMLKAGAVPAVMSALKHSNECCRAMAASVAAGRLSHAEASEGVAVSFSCMVTHSASPEAVKALLEAGLVPALMDIIRAGRSQNAPPASPGVFRNIKVELAGWQMATETHILLLPTSEPALHGCNALQVLARAASARSLDNSWRQLRTRVVAEVAEAQQAAAVLVRCLRQYDHELQEAPARLMLALLTGELPPRDDPSQASYLPTFCKQLLEEGLPDLMPSLIRPEQPGTSCAMLFTLMQAFESLGSDCLPSSSLPAIAAACAKYIEEGGGGEPLRSMRDMAKCCLGRSLTSLHSGMGRHVLLSEEGIETLAGIMVSGPVSAAWRACSIILQQLERNNPGNLLKAALSGGFVPGTFRLARERRFGPLQQLKSVAEVRALQWIVASGEEQYIVQAVDSGLLQVFQSYLRVPKYQEDALNVCTGILKVPSAMAKLREAGFAPVVTRAAHSVVELGSWVSKHCQDSGLVAEFVAAGLLEKLEKARRKMFGQFSKQHEVAALIDELARISSGQPAKQSEAGASSETPQRVPGKGSAADGGREQPGQREQRPAAEQEERVVLASASGAGGGGPKAERDPSTSRKQRSACMQCGKSRGDGVRLQSCSRCKKVVYCGQACQRSHWPHHKAKCIAKQTITEEPS